MLDFINYNKWMDFSHFVVNLHEGRNWDSNILKKNAIIFCHTDNLDILFSNIKFSPNKYILITGGSDWPIDSIRFNKKTDNIIKWFAINVTYYHPDLIPIPFGIYPTKGSSRPPFEMEWFFEDGEIERLQKNPKDIETLYCTWNYISNPNKRTGILQKLKNNGLNYIWDRPGSEEGNGENTPWKEYLENASHYKFMICPQGNGIETYRIWDALYLNCFPVVIKSITFNYKLPIIQVNDWSEVTYELLHSYLNKEYNMEELYMLYWEKIIINEFNRL